MKKRKYLYRVSAIILSCVFIPMIVLSVYFWDRASGELERRNQAYYQQVASSFANDFETRLQELGTHAISIVIDSKTNKSVFNQGVVRATAHPYWYYQAVKHMQENYSRYSADVCGVYYYELDRTVTGNGSYPTQYFLSGLGIREPEHPVWQFFEEENYNPNQWIFSSTFTDGSDSMYLLAGYCAELGKDKDKALILYTLSAEDYAKAHSVVYEHGGINFRILDKNRESTYLVIGSGEEAGSERYACQSDRFPLCFEIRIAENSLQNSNQIFYRDIRLMLMILGASLVLICLGSITVVYRPIFSITSELEDPDGEEDEFGNIRNALNQRHSKIIEQENLIMDFLMNHLIHGVPLSQKVIGRLGVAKNVDHYCVLVSNEYVLPASEVETLAERIEQKFSARLFCTDWHAANKSLLILFLPGSDVAPIAEFLNARLRERCGEEYSLTAGDVVDNIDAIRESFLSCLERLNAQSKLHRPIKEELRSLDAKDRQQKALEKKILEYLEKHFRDEDLSQVKVADAFQISTYTLSRLFKNQIGIGFREYVNSKRLEYAKTLLLTTPYSIKEIAEKAGYTSETYFGRIFKATYGISPSMFKDQ